MESFLDSSLDWSGPPGPLSAPPLDEECPDGQPPRDPRFAHDHREPGPLPSPPLDMKSSGVQPPANPVFADDNRKIVVTLSSTASASYDCLSTHGSSDSNDQHKSTDDNFLNKFDVNHFRTVDSHVHHERFDELLKLIDIDGERHKPASLMNDPVLNVIISANKTQLIEKVKSVRPLWEKNMYGDTALHIAAVEGNITVTKALLHREPQLVKAVNKKGETVMHKAAIYGRESMFWYLVYESRMDSYMYRKYDGSNVLHCAIMGNAPKLALDIARRFPSLILYRDEAALTPLHLIVTIPNFLRSPLVRGPLNNFLYRLISPEVEKRFRPKNAKVDEEAGQPIDRQRERDEESYGWTWKSVRSKFRSQYTSILYLTELIASWVRSAVLVILKQFYRPVNDLEKEKERYVAAMKLIEYIAMETSFDFYGKGYTQEPNPTVFDAIWSHSDLQYTWRDDDTMLKNILNEADRLPNRWIQPLLIIAADQLPSRWMEPPPSIAAERLPSNWMKLPLIIEADRLPSRWMEPPPVIAAERFPSKWMKPLLIIEADRLPRRWMEPPLIIAAELGLDDFVHKFLQVCPQSAIYLDSKGRNVMQVAIQSGKEKVVRVISEMLQESNPVLPSCLPSMLDNKTRNTILHLAVENSPAEEGDALQLHDELVWFELVEKIVPKELVYSRNMAQKTAHELFTERHKTTLDSCKKQLVEIGKMCSGLVAAVVFASSFTFPDEKKTDSVNLALTIFSHAYVIGFGCAASAMVLFMSLVMVPYKESYFRRAIPMQFLFACLSFGLALVAFLVSFACNFVVQIYGGEKKAHFIPIFSILELLFFPVICITPLLYFGAKFGPSFTRFLK